MDRSWISQQKLHLRNLWHEIQRIHSDHNKLHLQIQTHPYMWARHYSEVIMSMMVSQINGISIVYSTVCSGADQRKHQSYKSLDFVRGIHQWLVNSPHKGPVTWKMFPFDEDIMEHTAQRIKNLLVKIRLLQWRIRLPLLVSPIVNNKVKMKSTINGIHNIENNEIYQNDWLYNYWKFF